MNEIQKLYLKPCQFYTTLMYEIIIHQTVFIIPPFQNIYLLLESSGNLSYSLFQTLGISRTLIFYSLRGTQNNY